MTKTIYKQKSQKTRLRGVRSIGSPNQKRFIYRYMPIDVFYLCLSNNNIRFVQPSTWNDQFEKRFYEADYATKLHASSDTHPKLYALCTTIVKDCEPSWQMYSKSSMVQIKINRKKFLQLLSNYSASHNIYFYEGLANYGIKAEHISILHKPKYLRDGKPCNVTGHDLLFNNFDLDSYLNLLLLKRSAFSYEQEVRYFAIPKTEMSDSELYVDISWIDIIEEIRVSNSISVFEWDSLTNTLRNKGINISKLIKYDIYQDNISTGKLVIEP